MNLQLLNTLRILFNPKVTTTPIRVLRELRSRGIQRLPDRVQDELESGLAKKNLLSFLRQWLDGELLSRHQGKWVVNSFLPPFPSTAFNRMFENLLSGRRLSPVSAFLAITAVCPYRCWHCSHQKRKTGNLVTETWIATIQDLQKLGASIIGFTGGEPLTRPDLPQLVAAASGAGAATIIFSSGATIDEGKARALKEAGLWAFCVSLDHPDADVCNRMRGAGDVYEQALKALRLSRRFGFYTMIGTMATRRLVLENSHERLYRTARELGVDELRLVEPMPCGNLDHGCEEAFLGEEQVAKLRAFHVETNRKGRLPKVCAFNQVESPELFGCGAGTLHLFIDSAGEVCPCDFVPLSFGNVADAPLAEILDTMNNAMINPRRHCFSRKNRHLISQYASEGFPLPFTTSRKICSLAAKEALPDYFALITSQSKK
jgi:MoaA/NifB/PqqE/SkfB family radical SAM enzyme